MVVAHSILVAAYEMLRRQLSTAISALPASTTSLEPSPRSASYVGSRRWAIASRSRPPELCFRGRARRELNYLRRAGVVDGGVDDVVVGNLAADGRADRESMLVHWIAWPRRRLNLYQSSPSRSRSRTCSSFSCVPRNSLRPYCTRPHTCGAARLMDRRHREHSRACGSAVDQGHARAVAWPRQSPGRYVVGSVRIVDGWKRRKPLVEPLDVHQGFAHG